jgi:hypothetical protein
MHEHRTEAEPKAGRIPWNKDKLIGQKPCSLRYVRLRSGEFTRFPACLTTKSAFYFVVQQESLGNPFTLCGLVSSPYRSRASQKRNPHYIPSIAGRKQGLDIRMILMYLQVRHLGNTALVKGAGYGLP